MVKWSDTWYEKPEQNGMKFEKWVEKRVPHMLYVHFVIVS